jgi:hypothetical protein
MIVQLVRCTELPMFEGPLALTAQLEAQVELTVLLRNEAFFDLTHTNASIKVQTLSDILHVVLVCLKFLVLGRRLTLPLFFTSRDNFIHPF